MRIDRLDHVVLTVVDISATIDFYSRVLGMQEITFGDQRRALAFGQQKINLHSAGHPIAPHATSPTPGSADLCFIVTGGIQGVLTHLQTCGVTLEAGPVPRTGATGPITSVYFRDPDGNLLEVATYDQSIQLS
ncbi:MULTISPECIES: VOC family protein [Acidithiobacillus]|jgi:catechol 2,3-dioxygenase-like lactoylglutathione lyase family enzyme|uniref:Glyoxalase family protein n=8 Tax=Acidithiobacillaceae TaxID=225058 RepID=B7JAS4_ACIF2|nr:MULTISPECIES: VOC family protein [Acidithiobacillus]ACH84959.1 Glyoxalase/bleomycin resistance protein/dioxygenase [Acidithiobacillus ferrooxidans ATCC 53993]ACK80957.1 glyoxalase family protein [Acidithiobacillus ferrooxidans ATCC 23270]MBU2774143.1 VOC family protein [Acidithiobacillus ferrooxidans]MBU2806365.1 VOC family protein [Acidithiobacillus ferridurans]PZD81117.1 VOC family protein [Acidithiobacillus ferrooxidans]